MKKILFFIFIALTFNLNANVRFLDIPVDGSKKSVIRSLKSKGFSYNRKFDRLTGNLNGEYVNLYVLCNNRKKTWRIAIETSWSIDKEFIINRFNHIDDYFSNCVPYYSCCSVIINSIKSHSYEIPQEAIIDFERVVCQNNTISDTTVVFPILRYYQFDMDTFLKKEHDISSKYSDMEYYTHIMDEVSNNLVSVILSENDDEYSIWVYYDNYNNLDDVPYNKNILLIIFSIVIISITGFLIYKRNAR